jgi:hypothetical protein
VSFIPYQISDSPDMLLQEDHGAVSSGIVLAENAYVGLNDLDGVKE